MANIRLIATDVDGTLLDSRSRLSARNEAALRRARAHGVTVVLATGKTRHATAGLGLDSPGIFLQGSVICDRDGTITWQRTLEPALAAAVLARVEPRGFRVFFYCGMRIVARSVSERIVDLLARHHEVAPEAVGSLLDVIAARPSHKLMIVGPPVDVTALRAELERELAGAARVTQAGIPAMLEVLPPGSSKGAALAVLLAQLGLSPENVLAIGDAENDLEMVRLAGIGVALGQAPEALKRAAGLVVGTNDEDGFAQAVERFVPEART